MIAPEAASKRARLVKTAMAFAVVAGLATLPASAAADEGSVGGRPALDVRNGSSAAVKDSVAAGRRALDRSLGELGSVEADPATGGVADAGRSDGFLTGRSGSDAATIALDYVRAHPEVFALDGDDLAALRLGARSTSPDGITTLRWIQTVDGIASFDSGIVAHVARDGQLISVGGGAKPDLALADADAGLSPAEAYRKATDDADGTPDTSGASAPKGRERAVTFANGGSAELAVLAEPRGARLVWRTVSYDDEGRGYTQALDADTGEVLVRDSITANESNAEIYRRFPGASPVVGGSPTTVDLASNSRWLNDSANSTRLAGDYTRTYSDRNSNNVIDAGEDTTASGGTNWLFPLQPVTTSSPCPPSPAFCTWDPKTPSTLALNESSSATNLFFHVNTYHDHLLGGPIGFTPASGNFENGDRVISENNDGGGTNNANFATPPDGQSPRMQMYPRTVRGLQSSHSAETVYHEYTHGLTNRLIVNAAGGSALDGQQGLSMGEGWSDWYALDYLERSGYATDDPAAIGDLSYGSYWNGVGIRSEAIDCRVNDTTGRCASNAGGYTYQDIQKLIWPHTSGEMWSQTLWDVRRAIGSTEAERLVTDALRLSPASPTYVDMRDAILQADLATGEKHYVALWKAFAARGLGVSASSTSTDIGGAREAFDTPAATVADDPVVRDSGGDRDGIAEPGETVTFRPFLRNTTVSALGASAATVTSSTPGATVTDGATSWPALGTQQTAAADDDVTVKLASSLPCGTATALSATPAGGSALPFKLNLAGKEAPSAASFTSSTQSVPIPDNDPTGATSTITVPGVGESLRGLEVRIDSLAHTYPSDLELYISHNGGPRVALTRGGYTASGSLTFDDRGGNAASGHKKSTEPLSSFNGESSAGTWQLTMIDTVDQDAGTLSGWSIGTRTGGSACEDNTAAAATTGASGVTQGSATVSGTVDPAGAATDYRVVWGQTTGYGSSSPVASAGSARGATTRTAALAGLRPGVTYHYRLEALRFGEVAAAGADRTFTTPAVPGPPAAARPLAPPAAYRMTTPARFAFARTGLVRLSRGRVVLRLTGPASTRGRLRLYAGTRLIGDARFTTTSKGTGRVAVRLNKRGRAALRRARRGRLKVTAKGTLAGRAATVRFTLRR